MSIGKSVKIVSADRNAMPPSPTISKRHRLLVRIEEQLALAEVNRDGKPFRPEHARTYVDPATGKKDQRLVEKRLQKWWWSAINAKVYVELRYGSRPIELAPGKTAIELDYESQVIDALVLLKQAVAAGDLEKQLAAAGITWHTALRPKFERNKTQTGGSGLVVCARTVSVDFRERCANVRKHFPRGQTSSAYTR